MATATEVLPSGLPDVAELRKLPRRPGQASFFFHDHGFARAAVKVLPGEYFVHDSDVVVTTTLGSCVAACINDRTAGIGGMNHFMLPDAGDAGAGGRFGAFAMELLINELLKRGARRQSLEAKIFGGGQVMKSLANTQIGDKNVAFVQSFLAQERIPVLASDVLEIYPRKIVQFPKSGKVLCKRLPATHGVEFEAQEARYRTQLVQQPRGGEVELF
ncbi:chemoreceptor glutamine deamidase CheD [uncultured Ramlibacter sp.]|mgnify:CR=1 FL=1|uniref:chemoreceptor glutamine deamidase CheD n=1 Tax=uncultured Ramlibacter sp. TaxID=260755 RepID=UPI00260490D4|nr:chemoreceptor glutamine deamidase CheD [uncultured Ramlibacter sp.]